MQVATMESDTDMVVKRLSVPLGLEELMESLTKEVLRRKPSDIYAFASQHFAQLLEIRDQGNARGSLRKLKKSNSQMSKSSEATKDSTSSPVKIKSATFGTMSKMSRSKSPAPKSFLSRKNVQAKIDSNISPRTLHNNNKNSRQEKTKILMEKRRATKKKSIDEKKQTESNKQPLELESKKIVQVHRKPDNTKTTVDQRRRSVNQITREEKPSKDTLRSRSTSTNREGDTSKNIVDKSKRKTEQTRKTDESRRRKSSSKIENKSEKINIDGKSVYKETAFPSENMQEVNVLPSNMSDISDTVVTQMERQNFRIADIPILDGDNSQKNELHPSTSEYIKRGIDSFAKEDAEGSEIYITTEKQGKSSTEEVAGTDDNKHFEENLSENSDVTTEETDKISDAKIGLIIRNITDSDLVSDKNDVKNDSHEDTMKEKDEYRVPETVVDSMQNDNTNKDLSETAKNEIEEQQFKETVISEINIKNDNDSISVETIVATNEKDSLPDDTVDKSLQETTKDTVEELTQDTIIAQENEINLKNDIETTHVVLTVNEKDLSLNENLLEAAEKDLEEEQSFMDSEINIKNNELLKLSDDNNVTEGDLHVDKTGENDILDVTNAVIKIQSLVRGHLARKANYEAKLKSVEIFDNIDDSSSKKPIDTPIDVEGINPQSSMIDPIKAATKIQSMMRGYLARKSLNKDKLESSNNNNGKEIDDSIIKSEGQIIDVTTNKLNEVEVDVLQEERWINDELRSMEREQYTKEEIAAVAKIQAMTKGYLTRKSINARKSRSPETGEEEIVVSKTELLHEEGSNDGKITENVEVLTTTDDEVIPEVLSVVSTRHESTENLIDRTVAAVKIQALARGYLTRKAINKNNIDTSEEIVIETSNIQNEPSKENISSPLERQIRSVMDSTRAATIIQALAKGHLVRKKMKDTIEPSIKGTQEADITLKNGNKLEESQNAINEDINYREVTSNFLGLEHVHYESSRFDDSVVKLGKEATLEGSKSIAEIISKQQKPISRPSHEEESQDDFKSHNGSESTGFNSNEPFGDDVGPKPSHIEKLADVSNYMNSEATVAPMELSDLQKPPQCDELPQQRGHSVAEDAMKAATVIQALFRGYIIRKRHDKTECRLAKKKTFEEKLPTVLEVEDEENRDSAILADSAMDKSPSEAIEKIEEQIISEEPYLLRDKSNSANLQKNKTLSDDEVFAILKQLDDTPVPTEEPRRRSKTYTRSFTIDEPSIQQASPLSKSMTFVIGDEFQSFDTADSVDQSLKSAGTEEGSVSIDSTDSNIAEITTAIKEDVKKLKRTLENGLEMEKIVNVEATVGDSNITEITKGISDDVKQLEKTLSQDFNVEKDNLFVTSTNLVTPVQDISEETEEFSVRPLSKDSVTSTDSVDTVIFNDNLKADLVSGKELISGAASNTDSSLEDTTEDLNIMDSKVVSIEETSRKMTVAKEQSDILVNDILDTAAKKIQKFFRDARNKNELDHNHKEIENLEQASPEFIQELTTGKRQSTTSDELRRLWQDEAATTIQKNYKGYRVRRDLDNQKQEMLEDKKYKEELAEKEITRYLNQITEPVRRAFSAENHSEEDQSNEDKTRGPSPDISKPDTVYIPLRDYSDEQQDANAEISNSSDIELSQNFSSPDNEVNEASTAIEDKTDTSAVVQEKVFVKEIVKEVSTLSGDSEDDRMDKEIIQFDTNKDISKKTKPDEDTEEKISSYITAMVEPIHKTFQLHEGVVKETIVEEPVPVYQYIPLRSYSEDDHIDTASVIDDNVITSMSTLKDDVVNSGSDMKIDDDVVVLNEFEKISSEILSKDTDENISEKFEAIATGAIDKNEASEETTTDAINGNQDHAIRSGVLTESVAASSEHEEIVHNNVDVKESDVHKKESDEDIAKSDLLQLNVPVIERYASKEIDEYINSLIEPVKQKFSPYKEKTAAIKQHDITPVVEEPIYKYIPLRDYSVEGSEELKNQENVSNEAQPLNKSEQAVSEKSFERVEVDVDRKIIDVQKFDTEDTAHFLGDRNLTDHKFETHVEIVNKPEIYQNLDRLEEDAKSVFLGNGRQIGHVTEANESKGNLSEVDPNTDKILGEKEEISEISNEMQEVKENIEQPVEVTTFSNVNLNSMTLENVGLNLGENASVSEELPNQPDNSNMATSLQNPEQINDLKQVASDIPTTDKIIDQAKKESDNLNEIALEILDINKGDLEDRKNDILNSEAVVDVDTLVRVNSQNSSETDQNSSTCDNLKSDDITTSASTSESQMENIIKIEIKDKLADANILKSSTTEVENKDSSTEDLTNVEDNNKSAVDEDKMIKREIVVERDGINEVKVESIKGLIPDMSKSELERSTPIQEVVENVQAVMEDKEGIEEAAHEKSTVKERGSVVDAIQKENENLFVVLESEANLDSMEPVVAAPYSKNDNNEERAKDNDNTEEQVPEDNAPSQRISSVDKDNDDFKAQGNEDNIQSNLLDSDALPIKESAEQKHVQETEAINKDQSTEHEITDEEMQARIENIESQIEDVLGKINNAAPSDIHDAEKHLNETGYSAEDVKEKTDMLPQDIDYKESGNDPMKKDISSDSNKTENDNEITKSSMENEDKDEIHENENKKITTDVSVLSNEHNIHNDDKEVSDNIDLKEITNNLEKDAHQVVVKDESKDVDNRESQDLHGNIQLSEEDKNISDTLKNNKLRIIEISKTEDNIDKKDNTSNEHASNNLSNEDNVPSYSIVDIVEPRDTIKEENVNDLQHVIGNEPVLNRSDNTNVSNTIDHNSIDHVDIVKEEVEKDQSTTQDVQVSQPATENIDADKDNLSSVNKDSNFDKIDGSEILDTKNTSNEHASNNLSNEDNVPSYSIVDIIEPRDTIKEENVNDLQHVIGNEPVLNRSDNTNISNTTDHNSIDHVDIVKEEVEKDQSTTQDVQVSQPATENIDADKDNLSSVNKDSNFDKIDGSETLDTKNNVVEEIVGEKLINGSNMQNATGSLSNLKQDEAFNKMTSYDNDDKSKTDNQKLAEDAQSETLKDKSSVDDSISKSSLEVFNTNNVVISSIDKVANFNELENSKDNNKADLQNVNPDVKEITVESGHKETDVQSITGLHSGKRESDKADSTKDSDESTITKEPLVDLSEENKNSIVDIASDIKHECNDRVPDNTNLQNGTDLSLNSEICSKMINSENKIENMDLVAENKTEQPDVTENMTLPDVLHREQSLEDLNTDNKLSATNIKSNLSTIHVDKPDDHKIESINMSPVNEEQIKEKNKENELHKASKFQNLIPTEVDANQSKVDGPKNEIEVMENDSVIESSSMKEDVNNKEDQTIVETPHTDDHKIESINITPVNKEQVKEESEDSELHKANKNLISIELDANQSKVDGPKNEIEVMENDSVIESSSMKEDVNNKEDQTIVETPHIDDQKIESANISTVNEEQVKEESKDSELHKASKNLISIELDAKQSKVDGPKNEIEVMENDSVIESSSMKEGVNNKEDQTIVGTPHTDDHKIESANISPVNEEQVKEESKDSEIHKASKNLISIELDANQSKVDGPKNEIEVMENDSVTESSSMKEGVNNKEDEAIVETPYTNDHKIESANISPINEEQVKEENKNSEIHKASKNLISIELDANQSKVDGLKSEIKATENEHGKELPTMKEGDNINDDQTIAETPHTDDHKIESIKISSVNEEQEKEESKDNELHNASELQHVRPTELDATQSQVDGPKNEIAVMEEESSSIKESGNIKENQTMLETSNENQCSEMNKDNKNSVEPNKKSSVNGAQKPIGKTEDDAIVAENKTTAENLDLANSEKTKGNGGEVNNDNILTKDDKEVLKEQTGADQLHEKGDEAKSLQSDNDISNALDLEQTTIEKSTSYLGAQNEGYINGNDKENELENVKAAETVLEANEIPLPADKTSPFFLHQDLLFQNTPSIAQERKFSEALRLSSDSDKPTDNTETAEQLLHSSEYHDSIPVNITTETSQKSLNTQTNGVQCNIAPERTVPASTVLVHSGELHDNILPLALQMNQDPAGTEIVTSSPSKFHKPVDGDAQASAKDVSVRLENAKTTRAQSELGNNTTNMETERRNNSTIVKKNMESEAATKIQASFRGYQVRKKLKNKLARDNIASIKRTTRRRSLGRIIDTSKSSKKQATDLEEQSATKIQAGVRGFLVRRRQKKNKTDSA